MRSSLARTRWNGAGILALLGGLLLAAGADGQRQEGPPLPNPRLFSVTPSGGKVGSTVEVICGGTDLEEAQALLFSHPGIKAELLAQAPPPPPDPKKPRPRQAPPASSPAKFKVTIANDVPLGLHDVRLINKWGISNPRTFMVGDLAEVLEKEPNNDVEQAQKVDLNTTVTGAIATPTDVDYFVFSGKKGQRVVISCLASSIDSRLQPTLEVYDKTGRQLGQNRNYQGSDALLDYTLPSDGDYFVRLYQYTYTFMQGTGPADYFYRLSISTAPWIDAVFPSVVEPGKPAKLTVYGRNLPGGQLDPKSVVDGRVLEKATVTVNVPNDPAALSRLAFSGHVPPNGSGLDGFEYRIKNPSGTSNPFLLTYAKAPVVLDNEANDKPEQAQEITVPCEIAGRIEKKRDQDWYSFTAKKEDLYNIEVVSDRLGSPTYMEFAIINPATKQTLYESPDNPDTLTPFKFSTRTADPARYTFKPPADGKYLLFVKSQTGDTSAGPRHLYQVRITPNQPDFRLVLVPESSHFPDACVVRQGGNHYYDVFVWRTDGFNGEIALTVDGLPDGVSSPPQTIGPALRHGSLAISAAAGATPWTGEIKVKGTATMNGQTVVREARAGSVTWPSGQQQQNIVTISRLDRNLVLGVRETAPFSLTATPDQMSAKQGDKVNVTLKVVRTSPDFKGPLSVTAAMPLVANQPPFLAFNNNNQPLNVAGNDGKAVLTVGPNAIPGTYTIVLRALGQMPFTKDPASKQKPNIGAIQASTPFTITIVPKDLATLTVAANAAVKMGAQTEVVVKIARKFDFTGEFKVQLVLPPNAKGITADEVTIPAGQNEAKLVIKAAADAPPGNQPNLIVRATAMFNGDVPITHDVKLTVNISK